MLWLNRYDSQWFTTLMWSISRLSTVAGWLLLTPPPGLLEL